MATAAVLDLEPKTGTDIVVAVSQNPGIVLLDNEKFDAFYESLKAKADAVPVDLTTKKGRDAIASVAANIRSEKASIDKDRLRLTKEWRDMTAQVNDAWKGIESRLTGLAVDVRAPLTEWENAEKLRVDAAKMVVADLHGAAIVTMEDTAATVRERGTTVWNTVLDADQLGDLYPEAVSAKEATVATLKAALGRLTQEEADREELAKLRAEREAAEAEAAEKAAAEQAERDRADAERIEKERKEAAEQAEADRIQRAKDEAAQAERDRLQREHDAEIAAEREKAEAERVRVTRGREMLAYIREVVSGRIGGQVQPFGVLLRELESKVVVVGEGYGDMEAEIEQARVDGLASLNEAMERQAERRRQEEEREADRQRLAEEHERQQNKANRAAKKTAAKQAIMTCGVSEDAAQKVVLAIIAGEIPAVTLAF